MLPHPPLESHYDSSETKRQFVTRLFNSGAKYYDFVEGWGSFGTGARYRRSALERHGLRPGQRLLDVACGTGLVAAEAMKILGSAEKITCLDPSEGMLAVARTKLAARFVCARAEQIPLPDDSFEFLTMGYALRHVADLEEAFREYRRVLAPGGKLLILEITKPARPIQAFLFRAYFAHFFPFLALVFTRSRQARDLVQYYWETMDTCVQPARILEAMRSSGLKEVNCSTRFELFSEYTAVKS